MNIELTQREFCYKCYRPKSSCMCKHINKIETKTRFIILMHPKEYKKTKNITGHFTHLSLPNSTIFVGVDFSNHKEINTMIEDKNNNCYVLYPDENSINLNESSIKDDNKQNIIFVIDGTWPCAKKMLSMSKNLQIIPKISFTHNRVSAFKIKTQPAKLCLSTMESTLCVLELLDAQGVESIEQNRFQKFLEPFEKMVKYQYEIVYKMDKERIEKKKAYKS